MAVHTRPHFRRPPTVGARRVEGPASRRGRPPRQRYHRARPPMVPHALGKHRTRKPDQALRDQPSRNPEPPRG
eukprot:4740924-Heterocapsa_arctica.AAC.1